MDTDTSDARNEIDSFDRVTKILALRLSRRRFVAAKLAGLMIASSLSFLGFDARPAYALCSQQCNSCTGSACGFCSACCPAAGTCCSPCKTYCITNQPCCTCSQCNCGSFNCGETICEDGSTSTVCPSC